MQWAGLERVRTTVPGPVARRLLLAFPGSAYANTSPVSAPRHDRAMDRIWLGIQYRALRVRRELRQDDAGTIARLSRSVVSRIERGLVDNVRVGDLDRVAAALGARLDVRLRWQGEALDRLLDEAHAALVEAVVPLLRALGWEVLVEASFSSWGDRGSIDVLAFHRGAATLLVIEVKSVVPDNQATLAGLDRKARIAPQLAAEQGWAVRHVARLLVVGDSGTARRRIDRYRQMYAAALPGRGREVRRWLARPTGAFAGLLFLPFAPRGSSRRVRTWRVRVRAGTGAPPPPSANATAPRGRV